MGKTQSTLASSSSASFGTAMPSTSKPSAAPTTLSRENPKPNPNPNSNSIIQSQEDLPPSRATYLTRPELLRRRSHCLKQLSKCYKDHYWALMEELKSQYRRYYWEFGISPFQHQQPQKQFQENNDNNLIFEGSGENVSNKNKNINNPRCLFVGCKLKAMALTSFCHLHILSDSKQKLYKPCDYVIKSAVQGPITCGKPIIKSTSPALCSVHFQKAQKHVNRALKKAGLNVSSSSKLAPKFHVIVAEYIHQIQAKRRNALNKARSKVVVQEESAR
ncbi:hypothetical protein AB3S75_022691 [Citrus x aurantiifolia]